MSFKDRFNDLKFQNTTDNIAFQSAETIESKNPIIDNIKLKLSAKIASIPVWFEYSQQEKQDLISSFFDNWLKESDIDLSDGERTKFIQVLQASAYGFGQLDSFLSDPLVREVFIFSGLPVKINKNGEIISADIAITDSDTLVSRLKEAAGLKSLDKPVLKFCYSNLLITMVLPPVSSPFIAVKKKTRKNTDFEFLLKNNKIDENIYSFIYSLVKNRKNILISGDTDSGKSSYIEAIYSLLNDSVLLQNSNFIDTNSFICEGLGADDLQNIVVALNSVSPEYIVCDLNNGYSNVTGSGLISSVRASSITSAITQIAVSTAAVRKITEKQAKADIASHFDYIIHLTNDMFISSIAEFSLNKAGSLILTEILSYKDGTYLYKFPEYNAVSDEKETKTSDDKNIQAGSFKARFK